MSQTSANRPKVIFVGSFADGASDGSTGGQRYACKTLIESDISDHIQWLKIDSTMKSVPAPPVRMRVTSALSRLGNFGRYAFRRDVDAAYIMASSRLSFVEKGLMAIVAKRLGKRVVFSPRSGLLLDDYENSKFMRWYIPTVFRHCDQVICQGNEWQKTLRDMSGLSNSSLAVIPNWIDTSDYGAIAEAKKDALPSKGTTKFLYLGWLETYKGICDLIEAVDMARGELQGAKIIVCGRGSAQERAEAMVRDRELASLIEFRGWVQGADKHAELLNADVLVLPSHREGMPNALLEAMAAGLAVVATRVGGIPDVIEDGDTGCLIDAKKPDALAAAMVALHQDPSMRKQLSDNGRKHVQTFHEISETWPKLRALLERD